MEFMVSLVSDGTSMENVTPEQMERMGAEMGRFMKEAEDEGVLVHTGRLAAVDGARTLRYGEEGKIVVTDGPFAESKEQIAGYMILECEDLDEAVGWVERMPVLGTPSVEIRPIVDSAG